MKKPKKTTRANPLSGHAWSDPPPVAIVEEEKIQPVAPVGVTVIGTVDGLQKNTIATTPGAQPNLVVTVITPLVAMLVRAGYLFMTTWSGLVVAAMTPTGGKLLFAGDFFQMTMLTASLAVPVVVVGSMKDFGMILSGWEQKFPLRTGSV